MVSLSLLMITKNSDELLDQSLKSVVGLVDEIVLVDDASTDNTLSIAQKYKAQIYKFQEPDLGKKRAYALSKTRGKWILVLDADEIVSAELKKEIKDVIQKKDNKYDGFRIPFQNHFLGKKINHGGEDYKMLRLFKRSAIKIDESLVHEKFELKKGNPGFLKNKIRHYSYRSLGQMYKKFTDYAVREAKAKALKKEKSGFKKIFLYPPHMFWARFIKDKGYQDGIFRIPLDMGFAYMELLTYVLLIYFNLLKTKGSLR